MIQESLNQLFQTAAVSARLTPSIAEKAEQAAKLKTLKKGEGIISDQSKVVASQTGKAYGHLTSTPGKRSEHLKQAADVEERKYNNLKEQFDINPTTDLYQRMIKAKENFTRNRKAAAEIDKTIRKSSMDRVGSKWENAIQQDNDFKNRKSIILDSSGKPMEVPNEK